MGGPFHCDTEEEVPKTKVVQQQQEQATPPAEIQEAAVIETVDPVAPAPVEQEASPPPVCDPVEQVATPPVVEAAPVEAVNQEDQCPAPPTSEDVSALALLTMLQRLLIRSLSQ